MIREELFLALDRAVEEVGAGGADDDEYARLNATVQVAICTQARHEQPAMHTSTRIHTFLSMQCAIMKSRQRHISEYS